MNQPMSNGRLRPGKIPRRGLVSPLLSGPFMGALAAMCLVLGSVDGANASSRYLTSFVSTYPATVSSQLNSCGLCHVNPAGGGTRNPYGEAYRTAGHSFTAIENLDSDGDGYTNLQEIIALTFPGDPGSHPGAITDTVPPQVTGFTVPSSAGSLTVPISLTATDNVGVAGYLVKESSATPGPNASGWTTAPPTSYTFSSAGTKILYAWAKDAAGNVSAGVSASITITLSGDTTAPQITSFAMPPASSSLTVSVSLTATDNVGVTGYVLSESALAPAAGAAGWTSTAPSSYTFSSAGTKTLYAWAKDGAGNVSAGASATTTITLAIPTDVTKSINSTSQNPTTQTTSRRGRDRHRPPQSPQAPVGEQPFTGLSGYQVVAANDLGMHCGDLDQRLASILPPFNVLHAQVIRKGHVPSILDNSQVQVVYSAASNPQDPALVNPLPSILYKTNFWDTNPRTGQNSLAFDAFQPYYPPGILALFQLAADVGLPAPDLQQLYYGSGALAADQQAMPSATARWVTQPYVANVPQPFATFYRRFPFFLKFAFGYDLFGTNWFSAEGIPASPYDDVGRSNPYPLMRIQAVAASGNSLGTTAGTVLSSLDVVTPVAGEVNCGNCHTSSVDGGNGSATGALQSVATQYDDPLYGQVPLAVSIEYAFDTNILRLHDMRNDTHLEGATPVSCQTCHYTPALDLAHLGPQDTANGLQQTTHQSFSRVMHSFHGDLGVFPEMPPPNARTTAVRDDILKQTCYQCHPGQTTQCFRGAMFNAGQACQDCHGNMAQVGNDFSKNVPDGPFVVAGDFYTNPSTPRVPWANEPACQSCHTGDVNSNLASSPSVIASTDGLRLRQAYRTGDAMVKPIIAANRRFAENQTASGQQVLYRLSVGHGGVFCEGCHGSTHAEWPNATTSANDNVAAAQLQGHAGKIVECSTCHGDNAFSTSDFRGNFDANGWMKGPHGMHPVDQSWISGHRSVYRDGATPAGTCQACHGSRLQGSPLAAAAADRTFNVDDGRTRTIAKGTQVSCSLCHEAPGRGGDD